MRDLVSEGTRELINKVLLYSDLASKSFFISMFALNEASDSMNKKSFSTFRLIFDSCTLMFIQFCFILFPRLIRILRTEANVLINILFQSQ